MSERRTQIMEAVVRLLARGGVQAVTMRAVATEAGVSLRLVQYYGNSKDELLSATLNSLADTSLERWRARSERHGTEGAALKVIQDYFHEALPTDQPSRELHRVGVAQEDLAITHPDIAGKAYRKHLRGLADHLSNVLELDGLDAKDSRRLALEVMGLAHGVGTLLMTDQLTESDAQELVRDYLERLEPRLSR